MIKKNFLYLILFTILLYSCSDTDQEDQTKQKVSFNITQAIDGNGRIATTNLPPGTSLLISLNDASGNSIITHYRINLLRLGDSYITDPLELIPGRYVLTEFMLVNDSSEVLFATPLKNSKLSKIVAKPLPFSFVVGHNKVSNIEMEVVDAKINQPQDFGYASFNITIVQPLRISVFAKQGGQLMLTDAKAIITNASENIDPNQQTYNLSATINLLSLKGDAASTYTLLIKKDGYISYYTSFKYSEFIATLGDKPLKVILEEIPVAVPALKYWDSNVMTILSFRASGLVHVDYGNGETEERNLNYRPDHEGETDGNWILLSSSLPPGDDSVSVTGDLDVIDGFYQYDPGSINVSALTELKSITFEQGWIPKLDLSHNTMLTSLYFDNTTISNLILPTEHNVNSVTIIGDAYYREIIIADVYNNAIAKNIRGGIIDIDETLEPLSEETQDQLNILKNDYGWSISQNEE